MKRRKLFLLLGLVILLTVFIFTASPLYAKEQAKDGGIFRLADLKSAGILDPSRVHQQQDQLMVSNIYNALVNLVPGTWDVYPDLAERYEASNDKQVYTFYLRKGVKFHNGREMTAEDVVYSLKRAADPKSVNSARFKTLKDVEAVDKYTVRITLKQFDNAFLIKIAGGFGGVVPKEYVEKYGTSFGTSVETSCGTGPYFVKEWNRGRSIVLEANPNYFRGRAHVDQIELQTISNRANEYAQFISGRLDMLDVKPPYEQMIFKDPKWRSCIQSAVYPNIYWYGFNIHQEPFNNVKLRKALAYAFDRKRAIKVAGAGLGQDAYDPFAPGMEGHDPNHKSYEYDPEKAKRLLKEAGYPNGITLKLRTWNYTPQQRYTEFYQAQVAELGIKLDVEFVEMGTFRAECRKGSYPFYGNAVGIQIPDSSSFLYKYFHPDNFGPAGNYHKYENKEVTKYIERAMKEVDKGKRSEYVKKAMALISDDCPWIFDHRTQRTEVLQPWVHGLEGKMMGVSGRWPLINFGDHEIWIDAEKQVR